MIQAGATYRHFAEPQCNEMALASLWAKEDSKLDLLIRPAAHVTLRRGSQQGGGRPCAPIEQEVCSPLMRYQDCSARSDARISPKGDGERDGQPGCAVFSSESVALIDPDISFIQAPSP